MGVVNQFCTVCEVLVFAVFRNAFSSDRDMETELTICPYFLDAYLEESSKRLTYLCSVIIIHFLLKCSSHFWVSHIIFPPQI